MRKHKTALVTGASSGLGREFSLILAQKKYDIVAVARSESKLNSLKNELEKGGVTVYVCPVDLSVPDAALKVLDYTKQHGLTIDVLINNAGFGDAGNFAEADWEK